MRRSTLLRSGILCSTLLSLLILLPGWTTTGDAVPPSRDYNALVPPVAGFTGFPTVGVAPLAVSFSDMSSGGVTSWAWSFGDGGTSTVSNPSQTFTTPGNYTVTQIVTSSGGTDTMIRTGYIVVLAQPIGPDVIVGSISGRVNYGSVGGTSAYSVGTTSCNIGTQNLAWISGTNQHPVIGQNLYRLKGGVMDHIGVNWLKHGFYALDQSLCDTCSPTGGTSLGVGCSDPYSASLNGSQSPLGPRSEVDAATGAFPYPVNLSPSFNTTIGRRLQAHDVDIDSALNPGARYFVEAHYVTPDDASFGNKHNNASYREVSFSPSGSTFNLTYVGSTQRQRQAIIAWQDVDPEVSITHLDIPGDGRLTVGVKIWDLGNGSWRHVYAVHNLNSDRSVSAISVALPSGTTINASTFHDVDYHSGEVWSGIDWPPNIASNGISWATTQTHSQNQNANAIRWGSSYTFTFDADAVGGAVTLDLFKPGTPPAMTFTPPNAPAPVAGFSGTPTSGVVPLLVSFTDTSSGNIASWAWDFGDGATSTAQAPTHTYSTPGSYAVTLTVAGPEGADTLVVPGYINPQDPAPVAAFFGSPTIGVAPLSMSFTDQSTGNITSWSWSFGDGATSSLQNPSHTYGTPGFYSVSLTVSGPGGPDTLTQNAYIQVLDPPPTAAFSGTPTTGAAPLAVSFSDQSSGNVTSWSWAFGDGSTSTVQNPSHTYSTVGSYTVALTTTGPGGTDTVTSPAYVTVLDPPPVAGFAGAPTGGIAPVAVNFTDQSTGNVTGWSWTFGDTGTSTFQNPSHVYTTPGIYDVSLTVTGPGGSDTVTSIGHVTVLDPPPVAAFSASPTSGVAPVAVTFTDQSVGSVTSWSWSFGDGATSLLQNPTHTYLAPGSYSVTLTVTGPGGADTLVQSNHITATEKPVYVSFDGPTVLPGVGPVEDEDVVLWDPVSQSWSMHFDGSDMGLAGTDINAFHVFPDGSVLMSFSSPTFAVPGLLGGPSGNQVDSNDLILFGATTTGVSTSGFMLFIFDGSDVGLNDQDGGIDGVSVIFNTWLLISTEGQTFTPSFATLPGEDLTLFIPTLYGPTTTGFWFYALDGSDVGLSGPGEDIDALHFDEFARSVLSTDGAFSAGATTGLDPDVSRFVGTYGATAGGTIDALFDFSAMGITSGVNGLSVKQ